MSRMFCRGHTLELRAFLSENCRSMPAGLYVLMVFKRDQCKSYLAGRCRSQATRAHGHFMRIPTPGGAEDELAGCYWVLMTLGWHRAQARPRGHLERSSAQTTVRSCEGKLATMRAGTAVRNILYTRHEGD